MDSKVFHLSRPASRVRVRSDGRTRHHGRRCFRRRGGGGRDQREAFQQGERRPRDREGTRACGSQPFHRAHRGRFRGCDQKPRHGAFVAEGEAQTALGDVPPDKQRQVHGLRRLRQMVPRGHNIPRGREGVHPQGELHRLRRVLRRLRIRGGALRLEEGEPPAPGTATAWKGEISSRAT